MFVFLCSYCKVPVQKSLLSDLLPGPVTLVFQRSEALNPDLNPFTSVWVLSKIRQLEKIFNSNCEISPCSPQLVGVRIPDHNFMRRLCQLCGEPLALTSANISSHTSTLAVHVSAQ